MRSSPASAMTRLPRARVRPFSPSIGDVTQTSPDGDLCEMSLAPLRGGFLRWVPGRIPLSLHASGKAVEGLARTPLPNGRGAGVRAPAAGQRARQAPPERPRPHPVAPFGATRPLPFGRGDTPQKKVLDSPRI